MKFGLLLATVLLLISIPSVFLLTNSLSDPSLESSTEVHISAYVPESDADNTTPIGSTPSTSSTSGGGGGSASGQIASTVEQTLTESMDSETPDSDATDPTPLDGEDSTATTTPTSPSTPSSEATPPTTTESSAETETPELETPPLADPPPPTETTLHFGGYAFPNAEISFTLNGTTTLTLTADSSGYFEGTYDQLTTGSHVFTFEARDYQGNRSPLTSYFYTVDTLAPVYIPSILLSPLLYIEPQTSTEILGGVAIPGSSLQVYGVDTEDQSLHIIDTFIVEEQGQFSFDFDLSGPMPYDQYYVACSFEGLNCGYSAVIEVQTVDTSTTQLAPSFVADFTADIEVNYVDFSFMRYAFLNNKTHPLYDLNRDGRISLIDFSLLNYQWTL